MCVRTFHSLPFLVLNGKMARISPLLDGGFDTTHNDHRAGAGVDIVREYEVRLGSLQIQMKFYLEKMKLR